MFNFSSFFKISNLQQDLKALVQSKVEAAMLEKFYSDRGITYSEPLHGLLAKPKTKPAEPYFKTFYAQDIQIILSQVRKLKEITIQEITGRINSIYDSVSYLGITKEDFSEIISEATSSGIKPERILKKFPDLVALLSQQNNITDVDIAKILSDVQAKIYVLKNNINNNPENISIINRIIQSKSLPEDISVDLQTQILKEFSNIDFISLLKDIGFESNRSKNILPSPDDPNNTIPIYHKILEFLKDNNPVVMLDQNNIEKILNILMKTSNAASNPIRNFYVKNFKAEHNDDYDTESFLAYIGEALEYGKTQGFVDPKGDVTQFVQEINKKYNNNLMRIKPGNFDQEYQNIFKFSSKEESEVIQKVIRDEFQLACIVCQMHLPTPYGKPEYKSHFKIDFMIYCDIVNFEDQNGITIPNIIENTIFVGEYYGLYKTNKDSLKGTNYEGYVEKTDVKQVTEEVFSTLLDGGYFAVFPKAVKGDWALQVQNGLDSNNAIYNSKNANIVKKNPDSALNKLIEWYKSAPENLRQQYKQKLSKYIDVDTLAPKNGLDFKYNKYSTWFTMIRKSLYGFYLSQEINLNKKPFSFDRLQEFRNSLRTSGNKIDEIKSSDFNKTSSYLSNLKKYAYEKEELQEKLQYLDNLENFIKQHESEVDDIILKRFFQKILERKTNFKLTRNMLNFEEILKQKVQAFNLHCFRKGYNNMQENKIIMNNLELIQRLIRLSAIAEEIQEISPKAASEIDSFVQDTANDIPGEINDVSEDLFPPIHTPKAKGFGVDETKDMSSIIADDILHSSEFQAIAPKLGTPQGESMLNHLIEQKVQSLKGS